MNDPRTSFINLAVACCHARDWPAIETGFAGLSEPLALELAAEITRRLEQHAQASGDWQPWAEAQHHLPRPGWREAGQLLGQHLDAWTAPKPARPTDDRRRRLARLAVQLVKARVPSLQVIARLDEANAVLSDPIPGDSVHEIALWAAGAAGGKNAA